MLMRIKLDKEECIVRLMRMHLIQTFLTFAKKTYQHKLIFESIYLKFNQPITHFDEVIKFQTTSAE